MGWSEVGPGCYARRYESFDVTIGAIVGADGVVVIDTRSSLTEGAELLEDVRRLSRLAVRWVVNTHWHFDHCFGNAEVAGRTADVWGHDTLPGMLAEHGGTARDWLAEQGPDWAAAMEALVVLPPSRTLARTATIDVGDRVVELHHLGRGHTDGDIVVRVADAEVLYAGDLVEQSGPPAFGDDSFPLDWPATLGRLSGLLSVGTAVVPGHGAVVDRAFVAQQQADLGVVADTIRQLAAADASEDDALAADWPYPADHLTHAIRRGLAQASGSSG